MDLPITDYTDQYVQFCEKAGLPINEVPEDGKMGLQYELAMKETAPHHKHVNNVFLIKDFQF